VNTTNRIDHVDIPGGQKTQYTYFDNLGDQRLKQIKNLNPASAIISQFDYLYNPVGDFTSWTVRQGGAATANNYALGYDAADQLRSAMLKKVQGGTVLKQYEYDYDAAGNRYTNQDGSTISTASFNNLNQLMSQNGGGQMHFRGAVNEPSSVTVAGNIASVDGLGNFDGVADVVTGNNTVAVIATDTNNNVKTNNYQVTVSSGTNRTLTYDLNGNLINDGIKTYEWDAANRLTAINYTGTTKRSEFTYDGLGRRTKIVEKTGTTINSAKTFVWDGLTLAEERNNSNKVTRKHYPQGVQFVSYNPTTTTPYFYMRDHLGSVREMTDGTGTIKARYDYDPWGNRTKLTGSLDADFGFTGHYYHPPSNLHLAPYRGYDSTIGRWINRDPIDEADGPNLYEYVGNNPTDGIDPLGLYDLWDLGEDSLNFAAGLGDGVSFGGTTWLAQRFMDDADAATLRREKRCSSAFKAGEWASLGLGAARLAYAGLAKGASIAYAARGATMANAAAVSGFRNGLKQVFRLNPWSKFRIYSFENMVEKYGTAETIIAAAGRTNTGNNAVGAAAAAGGAATLTTTDDCECKK
jgi:RHS repeat-associated protein